MEHFQISGRPYYCVKKKENDGSHTTLPSDSGWIELIPSIQKTFSPWITYINGLHPGKFADPEKMLRLYRERDRAEKFIRALKEGIETNKGLEQMVSIFFVSFLAKYLINLTLTFVYPPNGFRFHILSNVSPQIQAILGDFVWKF